ncbi:MAG: DUF6438 domain-containing protein [Bacteroidota bacterium]
MKFSSLLIITFSYLSSYLASQVSKPLSSYTKTSCMGSCPAFRFEVYMNGKAFYTGKENVERLGKWSADVSDSELEEIKSIFEKNDFFSFKDRYYAEISDLPVTYIEFRSDGKEKKVMDYYGAPLKLKQLEQEVEAIIERLKWVRIPLK